MPILSDSQIDQQVKSHKSAIASSPSASVESNVASPSQDSNDSGSFMAGVTGFNHGVEKITMGLPQLVGAFGDKSGEKFVSTYEQLKENELTQAYKNHPIATAVGDGVGTVAASIPAGMIGGTAPTLAGRAAISSAQFGALGAVSKADSFDDRLTNTAIGIAGGAAGQVLAEGIPAVIGATKNVLGNVGTALAASFKSPDEVIASALKNTAKAVGGDLSKATFAEYDNQVQKVLGKVTEVYTKNDAALSTAADSAGVTVQKTGLKQFIDSTSQAPFTDVKKPLLDKAIQYYEGGRSLTFNQGIEQAQDLGTYAAGLMRSDPTLAGSLFKLKGIMLQDVYDSASNSGNATLATLAKSNSEYYRDVVAPFEKPANMLNGLTQAAGESFTAGMKKFLADPELGGTVANRVLQVAGPEANNNLGLAILHAMTNGKKDPNAFAATLKQQLELNPQLGGTVAPIIPNLIGILQGSAMAKKATPTSVTGWMTLFAGAGVDLTTTGGMITASNLGTRAWFLNTAGKMLRNSEAAMSLKQFGEAQTRGAAEPILTALSNRVIKTFKRFAESDPPKL